MISVGDEVALCVPDNPKLHGAKAVVESVEFWGAHVRTESAATGRFRALFSEMENQVDLRQQSVEQGYTGDVCDRCGSCRVVMNGRCHLCTECGETSGCS